MDTPQESKEKFKLFSQKPQAKKDKLWNEKTRKIIRSFPQVIDKKKSVEYLH
jgi:hypothetical protein